MIRKVQCTKLNQTVVTKSYRTPVLMILELSRWRRKDREFMSRLRPLNAAAVAATNAPIAAMATSTATATATTRTWVSLISVSFFCHLTKYAHCLRTQFAKAILQSFKFSPGLPSKQCFLCLMAEEQYCLFWQGFQTRRRTKNQFLRHISCCSNKYQRH